ncbi:MAG TPA: carboxypeptidase regulatory-like domain-containing protein [Bryobacteraceae bacterium]|nr:carboxypeptidase regulatory-like domain-containing protein [Bryobacteraceae bacterium]
MGCRSLLLISLFGYIAPVGLMATSRTGSITGTLTDPSGALVQKALVTVVNQETNAVRQTQTNDDGDFTVALLPPGHYQVTVEKQGFRRSVHNDVSLDVDQTARVDFILQVGVLTEELTVTDTPPLVQTDTSTLGQVVNGRQVHELPLNERNFLAFGLLVPGSQLPVAGSQNSTQGGSLSVNGAREQSNNFLLEGVDNNDPYINQYVALPSIDAIQEFKVQSSDYSAEFGRSGGAQINVILKSGTNQFHGGLFEFFRNRNLDAKNFFDLPDCTPASVPGTCGAIPRFDRNQFGGTLGGPVTKDKTFFFVAYEQLALRQATTRAAAVPSQVERQEALGAVPAAFADAAGLAVFNLFPAANAGSDLANSNTYISAPVIRNSEHLGLAKLDHHFERDDTLSVHYAVFDENRFNPFDPVNAFTNLPGYGSNTLNTGQNAGLNWTHVLTNLAINEFRFGFNRMRAGVFQQNSGHNISAQLGFPDVLTNGVDLGTPNVSLLGFDGIGEPVNYPQDRYDTTVHLADNLAWTWGRHQFKFGGDIRDIQLNNYLDFVARGEWVFQCGGQCQSPVQALAQLLAGIPDYAISVKGDTYNSLRSVGMGYYIQDDIHVVPRLVLNVGLRWEYNRPPVETHNRFSVPDLSAHSLDCSPMPACQFIQAGTGGVPRATYDSTFTDFAPRIGVAWRPMKSERWVVRGAYGIFYDSSIFNLSIFPRANPPFYELFLNPNFSGTATIETILSQPGRLNWNNMIARNFRDGYMQQWNVDLQYEVGPNWMVDLAYVGSKGTHLPDPIDLNQTNPATGVSPYPQFSSILDVESRSDSLYHGMQFRSEKRVGRDLAFLASYTFSKSIDDVSAVLGGSVGSGLPQDSNNLRGERALSDFNATHRAVLSMVYDLPLDRKAGGQPGLRRFLLAHWQTAGILTAQTGSPFTVNLPFCLQDQGAAAAFGAPCRPNLVANPMQAGPVTANPNPACHATLSQGGLAADAVETPGSWFNTCAFAMPATEATGITQFGSAGRNILTGPSYTNLDFALSKNVPLHTEGRRLQLRGEFFNIFNHPNFDIPSHVFGSANFGEVLSANAYGTRPPRQIQVGLKYVF